MEDYIKTTIDTYNKTANEYVKKVKGFVPINELEKFVEYVKSANTFNNNGLVLDIGCGSGVAARNLEERGLSITGIDLSTKLIDASRIESPNSFFYEMDMRKLTFRSEYFDGIWQMASLLHLEKKDVPLSLNQSNSILKENGIIYASVKMGKGEGLEKDSRYNDELKYYAYYEPEEIQELLENANFEVLENYHIKYNDSYRNAHPWINIFARKK